MKTKAEAAIGDAVEVRVVKRPESGDPWPGEEAWIPGTICHADEHKVGIAFADHTRTAYQRSNTGWRMA